MAEYQQATVAGQSWVRVNQINISVPYNATPTMIMSEETRILLDDGVTTFGQYLDQIQAAYTDPTTVVPLRDPTSDAILDGQTMTYAQFYQYMYSLARFIQTERDEGLL